MCYVFCVECSFVLYFVRIPSFFVIIVAHLSRCDEEQGKVGFGWWAICQTAVSKRGRHDIMVVQRQATATSTASTPAPAKQGQSVCQGGISSVGVGGSGI